MTREKIARLLLAMHADDSLDPIAEPLYEISKYIKELEDAADAAQCEADVRVVVEVTKRH